MTFLIFLMLNSVTSYGGRVEREKEKVCSTGIDAASDSLRADGTVNIFAGESIFVFDPHSRSLVDVFNLHSNFKDLDGPVEAAAASRRGYSIMRDFYLLSRAGRVYAYGNSSNGLNPLIRDKNGKTWREFDITSKLPLRGDTPNPDCLAVLCEGSNTCYYWRVFNNWKHRTLYCERHQKTSERAPKCHYDDDHIVTPKNMDSDLIKGIQTPCKAMAITHNEQNKETGLLYVDKENMHFFVNDAHEFTITVNDVFGCSSFLSNPIFWAALGISVLWILLVVPNTIIFIFIANARNNDIGESSVRTTS